MAVEVRLRLRRGLFVIWIGSAFGGMLLPEACGTRALHNVDAQVFPPALFSSAGIFDGGVEVQIEGYLPAGVFTFAKCYFCAAHNSQLLFLFASMLSTSSRMKYTKFPRFIRGTLCSLKTQ